MCGDTYPQPELQSYRPFRKCRSIQDVSNLYDTMKGRALAAEEKARALLFWLGVVLGGLLAVALLAEIIAVFWMLEGTG